jgi:hypothetical protein
MTTTKTITVRVEQRHLDDAYRRCRDEKLPAQENDPIALALREATGEECSVGFCLVKVGSADAIPLPQQALEFKRNFDKSVIWGKEERPLPWPVQFDVTL